MQFRSIASLQTLLTSLCSASTSNYLFSRVLPRASLFVILWLSDCAHCADQGSHCLFFVVVNFKDFDEAGELQNLPGGLSPNKLNREPRSRDAFNPSTRVATPELSM